MYPYGLVGNCQTSALVARNGSIDWLCMPRPDSPPVFGRLLDPEGGHFSVEFAGGKSEGSQAYLPNSAVLVTTVTGEDGSQYKITDFCPRFPQHGRMYRPVALFRIVEPVRGAPVIRVSCQPVQGWEKTPAPAVRGNSHLRYDCRGEALRLLTNMPLTYLAEGQAFALKEPQYFALTWSYGIEDDLVEMSQRFLKQTLDYWDIWVKHCSIPTLFQSETIRSAITLKLHCYEDTGAILAALTTSLPEEIGHERNWDYRFCWLRDAYFSLTAFQNLGHFEETEGFIKFLLGVAEQHDASELSSVDRLRPVYRLDRTLPLPEKEHAAWSGYGGSLPVRSDNQAAEHVQNDVYGEMVLTLAPIFFDERFRHLRTPSHQRLMERLGRACRDTIGQPDAGLWELRDGWQEHSFSNLMCWAGLERIQRIHAKGYLTEIGFDLSVAKGQAERALRSAVVGGALRNSPKDETVDASLLQLPILRFPDEELNRRTVALVQKDLRMGDGEELESYLYRYLRKDDFGRPQSAFLICSFWLVQALVRLGDREGAMRAMKQVLRSQNETGLLAEHFIVPTQKQAGNFPQAYSHVGQINAAFALSPPWAEIL